MPHYEPVNLVQDAFIPVCFEKQILPGIFEYLLLYLIEHRVDLSAFDACYDNESRGARAHHPRMLLKIALFAYSGGIIGCCRIEKASRENIQFIALSGETKPDHSIVSVSMGRSPVAIQSVFREVLLICGQAGLVRKELFSIDSVNLPSNASMEWSGAHDELAATANNLNAEAARNRCS